ncbi:unnamed protein product [Victoria cruziana]
MVSHCFVSWSPNPSLWRWRSVFLRTPLDVHLSPDFSSNIVCFREDDESPLSDDPFPADAGILVPRALSGLKYGPWAVGMVRGLGRPPLKPSTGGPGGGGADDGRGGGGGGGGDDEGDGCGDDDAGGEDAYLLPMLTVALASVHLGYCVGVWARDEALDVRFLRTGVGLFCLLLVSALRLKCQSGLDAYILGLGASAGVMIWTGERCFVKKESTSAGFVSLLAASMSLIFSAALYNNV